jgi:hypothetical protein
MYYTIFKGSWKIALLVKYEIGLQVVVSAFFTGKERPDFL